MRSQISYPRRDGNVLLEFSLIASVLFMVLAFTLDFGSATYSAQLVRQAADHIAREVAVAPLPATDAFTDLGDASSTLPGLLKSQGIYAEDYLVMDITAAPAGTDLLSYLDGQYPPGVPTGNRLLVPLMVQLESTINPNIPAGSRWLVYPGALVASSTAPTGFTVRIPTVQYGPGTETISPQANCLRVVELEPAPFQLTSPQRGVATVRVNYPFQAAAVSGRYRDPNDPDTPPTTLQEAYIPASDALQPGQRGGPYSGVDGLGLQAAFTTTVRPFRRIVSGQGVYRREVFQ